MYKKTLVCVFSFDKFFEDVWVGVGWIGGDGACMWRVKVGVGEKKKRFVCPFFGVCVFFFCSV